MNHPGLIRKTKNRVATFLIERLIEILIDSNAVARNNAGRTLCAPGSFPNGNILYNCSITTAKILTLIQSTDLTQISLVSLISVC